VEKIYGPRQELPIICADVVIITRALCDATGERRGDSRVALQGRIRKAIHGYLREQLGTAMKA
jgi:hypothetical protein